MGETSGDSGNFVQRYLRLQSHSPDCGIYPVNEAVNARNDLMYSPSRRRTMECQNILDRISTFCAAENLGQRVAFLDQELSVYGYPLVAQDSDGRSSLDQRFQPGSIDLVMLVNITYDLLQRWRQSTEAHNEANDHQRTLDTEIVRLRHLTSRLKEDIANKDRDLKSKELKELKQSQRFESLKKNFKLEQEKSKRLTSEMAARDVQFRHEKKKKLQEIEKLQSTLQQLLHGKRQERMLGIEVLNSLQRSDGKRGKWSTDKTKKSNEQDMYRLIITNYEDSHKQLLKENEGMRKYLKEMQNELISALNENTNSVHERSNCAAGDESEGEKERLPESRSSSSASNRSEVSEVSEPMSDGVFEMPYDMVKEDIERSIRTKWRALKKEIKRTRKAEGRSRANRSNPAADIEYEDLVQKQQELIDYLTTGQADGDRPIPEDCYFLEEKAELEKQKSGFNQEKQAFEKERQLYADALLQLDEQKRLFETEKNKWFQHNFLNLTPFRTGSRSSNSPHHNIRSKDPSSQRIKARQQPYRTRSSFSPDKPAMQSMRHSIHSHLNQERQQSPNNMSHSLSRLHSSSHSNSFSPESLQQRLHEPAWSNLTLEGSRQDQANLPKTKSTPNTSFPSTAELYRNLGLVYYGSDKENADTANAKENTMQACPRSSGSTAKQHASLRHLPPSVPGLFHSCEGVAGHPQTDGQQDCLGKFPFGNQLTKEVFKRTNFESCSNPHSEFLSSLDSKVCFRVNAERKLPKSCSLGQSPKAEISGNLEPHVQCQALNAGVQKQAYFEGLQRLNSRRRSKSTLGRLTSSAEVRRRSNSDGNRSASYEGRCTNFKGAKSHLHQIATSPINMNPSSNSTSPEYLSATASLDDENRSTSSDYYDAQKNCHDGNKDHKMAAKEISHEQLKALAKNRIEKSPFFKNEFQISANLPKPGSRFVPSVASNPDVYMCKSADEKMLKLNSEKVKEVDQNSENSKSKISEIRSFVRNLFHGFPKLKQNDLSNNSVGNLQILSNSDSALSLSHCLNHGAVGPSVGLLESSTLELCDLHANHQRTWSYPGVESSKVNKVKRRSSYCGFLQWNESMERHKYALLSATAGLKPNPGFPANIVSNVVGPKKETRGLDPELVFQKTPRHGCLNQAQCCRFKLDENPCNFGNYEVLSHSTPNGNSKASPTRSSACWASSDSAALKQQQAKGSRAALFKPGLSQLRSDQGFFEPVLAKCDEPRSFKSRPVLARSGLVQSKGISAVQRGSSLLEKLVNEANCED